MDGWADMVGFNIHYDVVAPLPMYVLQELIGIKNETGNKNIWFGVVQEAASTETYQNTILGHIYQ